MAAQPRSSTISVEEYLSLDRDSLDVRYEFIDGHTYMMAGGTSDHSTISINLTAEFKNALRGSPCRVYNSDMRVRLSKKRYVYPDASVSCDPHDRGTVDILQHPRLIVEVLSPSTEAYDRIKKFSYYRACPTIEEYVLVDAQQQEISVYRREQGFWKLYFFGPGDQVILESIGISIPLANIYENVSLPEEVQDNPPM